MLRELGDVIARPVSVIFERLWRTGEVPEDWRIASDTPVFLKRLKGRCSELQVSLTSLPGKIMEQILLEAMLTHMQDKEVIRGSHHSLTKGKLCLTDLGDFCDGATASTDKGRPMDAIYLDFCKAFDTVPHNILISKWKRWI